MIICLLFFIFRNTYCSFSGQIEMVASVVNMVARSWALLQSKVMEPKYKVKCTLVQAMRLCTGHTVHRGTRGIDLPFYDHGTRRG
jgi:hypothetical protein